MASYIELDKQASFPASSNIGKVIFGVDSNGNVITTNNNGITKNVTNPLPYSEYTSKISRIGVNSPKTSYLLNNTLDINPIWTRVSSGNFRFKFDNEIDIDKTISNVPLISGTPFSYGITNELNPSNNFKLGFNDVVNSIATQSDGKILVGGRFTSYNGTTSNYIIRLNTDGSIDDTFSIGSGFDFYVLSISIQSDGKILVGGSFTSYNGTNSNYIIRLNSDGGYDITFSIGGGFDNGITSIAIQSDGKILVGGSFTYYNGTNSNYIIRLNSDGSFQHSFDDAFLNSQINSIAIQSDGNVLVGGYFSSYNDNVNYITKFDNEFFYNLIGDDNFENQPIEIKVYN